MMPDACASMRSIARWVLPVLVGPSTAVTPWPRATTSREGTEEKEMAIRGPASGTQRPLVGLEHVAIPRDRNVLQVHTLAHALVGELASTPDQVRGRLSPGHALTLYHNATPGAAKSLPTRLRRTSPERIAAESVTRRESGFVPPDIWSLLSEASSRSWGERSDDGAL